MKSVYRETYKAGTEFANKNEIIDLIKQPNVVLMAVNGGVNDNDTEYITLRIDGINRLPVQSDGDRYAESEKPGQVKDDF
jgi:uncharacterized protein YigE (DUF2233 family)